MNYLIADEIISYETNTINVINRFRDFEIRVGTRESNANEVISIDLDGLDVFSSRNYRLSSSQCELIYSMQKFFWALLSRNKLLIHASLVDKNNQCHVFVGNQNSGKSFISSWLVKQQYDCHIISDDRSVIGMRNGQLVAWSTPWSKVSLPVLYGVPVKNIFLIERGMKQSVCSIDLDRMISIITLMFPAEIRLIVSNMLYTLIKSVNLYQITNDMVSPDFSLISRMI